jgi:choline-sulfatase
MRQLLVALMVAGSWLVGSQLAAQPAPTAARRPNILVLMADDLTYSAIGNLGELPVETPNLDRLARSGLTFSHAYNPGSWSGAVCIASRTMLVTGRYLWHAAADESHLQQRYVQRQRLWPQPLHSAGYRTYFAGKWHVATDPEKAFDVVGHLRPGMPQQTEEGYNRPRAGHTDPWKPWDTGRGGYWNGGRHWSEVLVDDAEGFLESAARDDRPFLMYLAFNAPHDPRQSPQAMVDRYSLSAIPVPASLQPEFPWDIGSNRIRDELLAPFPRTEHAVKVHRQEYFALITHLDLQIGRVLAALSQYGLEDSTFVFFTADHGLAIGAHGLMGKQNQFEHSVRAPFVVCGPGVPAGRRVGHPIYIQDLMPTTLELAGVEIPEDVEFRSLAAWVTGSQAVGRRWITGAYQDFQRMICDREWKLIVYPQVRRLQLFHLAEDPHELHDLAPQEEYKATIARLYQQLRREMVAGDDPLPLPPLTTWIP